MSKPDVLALRKHVLKAAEVPQGKQTRNENSVDVNIGPYKMAARLDEDGHLNLFVRALDDSETPIEIEPSEGIPGDLELRFTLPSIEEKCQA